VSDVDVVLDTDFLIEILRGDSRAGTWLASTIVIALPIHIAPCP